MHKPVRAYPGSEAGWKTMRKVRYQPVGQVRRRPQEDGLWKLLGCAFIAVGLLLLFLCIPGWAWAAMAGSALICAGWALIGTCRR